MKLYYVSLLFLYLGLMVGMAIEDVGRPANTSATYQWWLPISVAMVIIVPAVLAYIIAKEEN